ncbi:MAG: glycerol dehydrogenase [Candidatus Brocadiae bacterium]|nr:glycerol dehydrogenase [Candidatus Brocadiia bacterium]
MKSVLIAPRKYVQGKGVLEEIGTYLALLGKKPMVLWDGAVKGIVGDTVLASIQEAGLEIVDVAFNGETTRAEAARVAEIIRDQGADVSVGIGGGKCLDTAKAASVETGVRLMTCPTIASNDSPTSGATVWYDDNHFFLGFDCWPFNPDIVMVDTQVIAGAPVRALVAGMGDALSTWVETESALKTSPINLGGGVPTQAAIAIARLCFDTLMEHGVEARRAAELNLVTPAVERIVEANVLLSGLGFESGGLATAHMIGNLLTGFPECNAYYHGEKVAFGVVSQLCLDPDVPTDEKYRIVDWCIAVGLPVTFAALSLEGVERERLATIGDVCAGEGSLCANHRFEVTSDGVVDAMFAADALGRERLGLVE